MKRSGSTIKEKGKSEKQTRKTKQHGKTADDPQIPQPDLRFASGSKSKQHKTGPGPTPNKTNDFARASNPKYDLKNQHLQLCTLQAPFCTRQQAQKALSVHVAVLDLSLV